MAGKKQRGRKDNAHNKKYSKDIRTIADKTNKARKQQKHKKVLQNQALRSEKRIDLLEKCINKYNINTYFIKRLIGTPNIKRLTSLLDGSFVEEKWFTSRTVRSYLREKASGTKITTAMIDAMRFPHKEKNTRKRVLHGSRKRNNIQKTRRDKSRSNNRNSEI